MPVGQPQHKRSAWHPAWFDWKRHHGEEYRYFFVRHKGGLPADLFKGAECTPALVIARGNWKVFERRACR